MASLDYQADAKAKIGKYYYNCTQYFMPTEESAGTYVLNTDWVAGPGTGFTDILMPVMNEAKFKPIVEADEYECNGGNIFDVDDKIKGWEWSAKPLQRDVLTIEWAIDHLAYSGVLLVVGHRFLSASYSKQQYIAMYGKFRVTEDELDNKHGQGMIKFRSLHNRYAVDLVALGDLVPPVLSPAVDLDIPIGQQYDIIDTTVV